MKYIDNTNLINFYKEPVSLTKMTSLFKEAEITRGQILQYLQKQGFIIDIHTPTEYGLQNGVSIKTYENKSWPVYDESIQRLVANSLDYIKETFPIENEGNKKEEKKIEKVLLTEEELKAPYIRKYCGIFKDFVILDTETTGLENDDEVVQIGIIDSNGNSLMLRYFYPEKEVNPFAAKVNHLNKKILKDFSYEQKFDDKFWYMIKEIIGDRMIIGHNIGFDKRMIAQTLQKNGYDLEKEVEELFQDCFDTKPMAKRLLQSSSYSLNNLTTLVGITREEQHDALDDCLMTLEFINRLEDILVIKNEYDFVKKNETILFDVIDKKIENKEEIEK